MGNLLLIVCFLASLTADEQRDESVPSPDPEDWSWAEIFTDQSGRASIVCVEEEHGKSPATLVELRPGFAPKARSVIFTDRGTLAADGKEIAHFANLGRNLIGKNELHLVARWIRMRVDDHMDDWSSAVPLPVDSASPLRRLMKRFQSDKSPKDPGILQDNDERGDPVTTAIPPADSHYFSHSACTVMCWSPNLVSVLDVGDEYSGGAHPNISLDSRTWIRAKVGGWQLATLNQLFGPDGPWRQEIIDAVLSDLKQHRVGWFSDPSYTVAIAEKATLLSQWNIAGDGLVISFEPYVMGPHSDGDIQVRLPWASLPPLVDSFPTAGVSRPP
jgi:hypothetical protein